MDADLVPPSLFGGDLDAGQVLPNAGFQRIAGGCRPALDGERNASAGPVLGQLFRSGTNQGRVRFLGLSEKELSQQEGVHSIGFSHY